VYNGHDHACPYENFEDWPSTKIGFCKNFPLYTLEYWILIYSTDKFGIRSDMHPTITEGTYMSEDAESMR
jgi:hypothetical protein